MIWRGRSFRIWRLRWLTRRSERVECLSVLECAADGNRLVRDQAFKAMNMFMKRIEGMVATMVSLSAG